MSDESIYVRDYKKFMKSYSNKSCTENKAISNVLSSSDLRNNLNRKSNSDEERSNFKAVRNCQPDESIYVRDYKKFLKNCSNTSSTENKSNSNVSTSSVLRNNLKRKNNSDESNELEGRNRKIICLPKEVFSSDDIDLYKEYVQWDFINNKLYKRGEELLNIRGGNQKREFTNTLQMWLIFINEDFNDVPKYEYFSILPDIQLEHPAAQFLRTAIMKKNFATEDDADLKVKEILSFISRSHSEVVSQDLPDPLHVEHNKAEKFVVVNKFQSEEMPRVNLLVRKGGVIATARVLLRYESLGNGSYQWGDPEEVHQVLYDLFKVRYEGFASPVNSRFIEYEDADYCSLFPDTDAAFGSLGNFFDVDMEKLSRGWSVNPPFLNDLLKNVAIRINEVLDAGHKCYFFCTFPNWDDDDGWNILNNSRHMLKRFNLPPHHFIVQDAYGNKLEPNMSMNLFVMGELPPDVASLNELGNILIHNPMKALPDQCPW